MRNFALLASLLLVFTTCVDTAFAQPHIIQVDPKKSWRHKPSGIAFPAMIQGMKREREVEYTEQQQNISVQYVSDDQRQYISIYVYQTPIDHVKVWMDSAQRSIFYSQRYHNIELSNPVNTRILTLKDKSPQILVSAYDLEGQQFRSTLVAMAYLGPWMIKLRASSMDMSSQQLEQASLSLLQTLKWPGDTEFKIEDPPIEECENKLEFADKAKRKPASIGDSLMGALLNSMLTEKGEDKETFKFDPVLLCKDSDYNTMPIYQTGDDGSGYFLVISDSGTMLSVQPALTLDQLENDNSKKGDMRLTLYDYPNIYNFGVYQGLLSPEDAISQINSGKADSRTRIGDDNYSITLDTGGMDKSAKDTDGQKDN